MAKTLQDSEEIDSLTTIVLNSLSNGFLVSSNEMLLSQEENVKDLHNWTCHLPESITLEEYQYRLKVAKVSLARSVKETMVAISSRKAQMILRKPILLTS